MIGALRLAAGIAVWLAAGRGVLRLAGAERLPLGPVSRTCGWLVAGAAAGGVLTSTLAVAGLPVRAWPLLAPLLLLLAVAGGRPAGLAGTDRLRAGLPREGPVLLAALLGLPVLVVATVQQITVNDEYGIWALKARMLDAYGHLGGYLWTADVSYDYSHRDYPLLVPSIPLWGYGWMGREDPHAAHLLVTLVALAALIVAVRLLTELAGPLAGYATVVVLGGVQGLALQLTWVMADTITMAYGLCLAVTLVAVCSAATREAARVAAGLAAVVAAGGAIGKNEGAAFTAAILLAGAAVLALTPAARGRLRLLIGPAAAAAGALLPWWVWVRAHGLHSDVVGASSLRPDLLVRHLGRTGPLLAEAARLWPGPAWPGLLAVAAATAAALATVRAYRRSVLVLLGCFLLTSAALLLTYLVAPFTGRAYWASNLSRVLLLPAALCWTLGAVSAAVLVRARSARAQPPAAGRRVPPARWPAAGPQDRRHDAKAYTRLGAAEAAD